MGLHHGAGKILRNHGDGVVGEFEFFEGQSLEKGTLGGLDVAESSNAKVFEGGKEGKILRPRVAKGFPLGVP